jgi:hypothetical protein
MTLLSTFRFGHEPTDSARDTARLHEFHRLGLELGAAVTVWYCDPCDEATATFTYADLSD